MSFKKEEVAAALTYADRLLIKASLDPSDNKTLVFTKSEEIPAGLDEEIRLMLDLSIQYYQRSVFTGEYLQEDSNPPVRVATDAVDDLNFFLGYYKDKLLKELRKALDVDTELKAIKPDGPKLTPYAEAMLKYRKEMMKKTQKSR